MYELPYFSDHKTYFFPGKFCIKFPCVLWFDGPPIWPAKYGTGNRDSLVALFAGGIRVLGGRERKLVRFQVLTAASMMFRVVFWDILPCKIIVDRRFRGAYCLHYQG
jgi:hypothetical protein